MRGWQAVVAEGNIQQPASVSLSSRATQPLCRGQSQCLCFSCSISPFPRVSFLWGTVFGCKVFTPFLSHLFFYPFLLCTNWICFIRLISPAPSRPFFLPRPISTYPFLFAYFPHLCQLNPKISNPMLYSPSLFLILTNPSPLSLTWLYPPLSAISLVRGTLLLLSFDLRCWHSVLSGRASVCRGEAVCEQTGAHACPRHNKGAFLRPSKTSINAGPSASGGDVGLPEMAHRDGH